MAILRGIPRKRKLASYTGRVMVDTVRGMLRVRKWPKKRGKPKSADQRFWVDWFKQANLLAKYVDPIQQARAIEMTKGSGAYPRDVLLKAMRGRLFTWVDETGWRWYSMAAIGDISETLDVLAQSVGDVLVRAVDRWRPVTGGGLAKVLTHQGPDNPAVWAPATGGVVQAELAESPISPDNTVSQYIFDVAAYLDVAIIIDEVDLAAADAIKFTLSTDGGITYHAGATDYFTSFLSAVAEGNGNSFKFDLSDGSAQFDHYIRLRLDMIQAVRMSWSAQVGFQLNSAAHRAGWARFNGPITHVKIFTNAGQKFTNGVIRAMGTTGA